MIVSEIDTYTQMWLYHNKEKKILSISFHSIGFYIKIIHRNQFILISLPAQIIQAGLEGLLLYQIAD